LVIDTSIVVDLTRSELRLLSARVAVSALTVAESVKGRQAAPPGLEKERRRRHLQRLEASIEAADLLGLDHLIEIIDASA
jgi:predicted nucleic acid-binding protein